jgi:hypothetical protein
MATTYLTGKRYTLSQLRDQRPKGHVGYTAVVR